MFPGLKLPDPPPQIPVVVGPPTEPESTVFALFLQEYKFTPGVTDGVAVKRILTVSMTGLQFPLLVEVSIKSTNPAFISEALGLYNAFKALVLGLNVPVPPDQTPVVVDPEITPAN